MKESPHDALRTPDNAPSVVPAGKFPYTIVGIFAAEGDIHSLLAFFSSAPATTGMVFAVMAASGIEAASLLRVLPGVTAMPVTVIAAENAPLSLQADNIYVITCPAASFSRTDTVEAGEDAAYDVVPTLDLFIDGLVEMHHERAMMVILAGMNRIDTTGIVRFKERGGITLAETPPGDSSATVRDDVRSAGAPDFTLPVARIPAQLVKLSRNTRLLKQEVVPPGNTVSLATVPSTPEEEQALRAILGALLAETGHDFEHYKPATILRRITRRMQISGLPDLFAYRDFIAATPAEIGLLLHDLLIGVTHFFRDREAFTVLQRDIVPALFDATVPDEPLRVWVPGCSTGEEAYSVAMILHAHAEKQAAPRGMQIFATDIDARAIGRGRLGRYSDAIVNDLGPDFLLRYFRAEFQHYQVKKSLRKMVLFAQHDLLRDPPFAHLDLVSCRNLLIYLDSDMQRRALQLFHFSLRPGGYLFLGNAENVDVAPDLFDVVDKHHRIFRSRWRARSRPPTLGSAISRIHSSRAYDAAALAALPPVLPSPTPVGGLHEQMMLRYGPPSIMVNRHYDVMHISERAVRHLRHVGGEPSQWLPDILRPELKTALRAALNDAVHSGHDVDAVPVVLVENDRPVTVVMSVHLVASDGMTSAADAAHTSGAPAAPSIAALQLPADPFALVIFHETDGLHNAAPGKSENTDATGANTLQPAVDALERELRDAKRQVRVTLAHADGSVEALKASNEELQAMNEELHSTTEELETSKEELQAINEELLTVNSELQAKIHESGKTNDDLTNLISSSNIATLFVDRSMVLSRYTPAAAALFNVIPSDIGRSLLHITHRLDYPDLASDTTATFESLKLIEKEVAGPDGRWYLSRLSPYRTAEDHIEGTVLTLIDITSRRDAQRKMRASEQRMQLVVQSTNDYAIIVHDMSGAIVTWNKGAEHLFGYTEAEMLGRSGQLIYTEEDRRAGVGDAEAQRALTHGRSQDEGWLVRKDGTRLYCSGVTTALHSDDFHGYAKIARDLTDGQTAESAKQLEHSLERSVRKQVDTANRLKDEFLAVLSHELKNPLNLIHVKAEMLSRAPDARDLAVVREASDAIRRSVAAQAKIIDDLLDLSRVRTGKLTLNEETVDVARIINAATDALESDAAAAGLMLTASGTLTPVIVLGDETRIEQIVWNLLSNALKFTPSGGRVSIAMVQEDDELCIRVTDTGRGIDPAFLPHIFDMFSQAESAFNRELGGLGIGLALVQQLAQMHGGRVSAESEGNGLGACFRVWLPRGQTNAHLMGPRSSADAAILRDKKILLVDDTLETLEAFRVLLELEGAQVRTESNGEDALRATTEEHFDIILSDIGMPGMDGYEFMRMLRKASITAATPAVAITGFGRSQDVDRALEAGFNAHLGKPVSLDALLVAIGNALTSPE